MAHQESLTEITLETIAAEFLEHHGISEVARTVQNVPAGIRTVIEAALKKPDRNGYISLGDQKYGKAYLQRMLDVMNGVIQ